ncbi:hypothetical protein Tco_0992344 [Tanacetum coccineum]|uniref:Reverse transcriptase domain-containing protein n=1 Tax=Tanacetum coccineum TaxID=301880 RepID=A0ABQ5F219_9ASTR
MRIRVVGRAGLIAESRRWGNRGERRVELEVGGVRGPRGGNDKLVDDEWPQGNGNQIKKVEKRGNIGESSKDKNGRDDDKRTRSGNAFATTANPIGRENTGAWPKCTTCNSYHAPGGPYRTSLQRTARGQCLDIDLILFGHGSFDVIIGDRKDPEKWKARLLMSAKASDMKQEEIVVVRDFPEVFPDDLSGFQPLREIEFQIELIPRAVLITKSPYHLAPFELEELSGQLKEL